MIDRRFRKLFCIFLLLMPLGLMAQMKEQKYDIDSIWERILMSTTQDQSASYNTLSKAYLNYKPDSALHAAEKALKNARKTGNKKEEGIALKNAGNYYLAAGRTDTALALYLDAKSLFQKHGLLIELLRVINNVGLIYKDYHKYDLALEQFHKAMELSHQIDDITLERASIYSNLAGVYYFKNRTDLAFQYVDSAQQVMKNIPDSNVKGSVYGNLAMFYNSIGRYDKALVYFKKAKQVIDRGSDMRKKALVLTNMGDLYRDMYNYDKAFDFIKEALALRKKMDDTIGMAVAYSSLGQLEMVRKNYGRAIELFQNASDFYQHFGDMQGYLLNTRHIASALVKQGKLQQAKDTLLKHLPQVRELNRVKMLKAYYQLMATISRNQGAFEDAVEYQQQAYAYKDSVRDDQQQGRIQFLKMGQKIKERQLEEQIAGLENQLKNKQGVNRLWIWLLGAMILAAAMWSGWLVMARKRSKEKLQQRLSQKDKSLAELQGKLENATQDTDALVKERTAALRKEIEKYKKKDSDLKKALKDAEDANYLKNAFLSNMSHEIRTPLNGIIGFSSLLETELSLMENDELYGYAQGIQTSGERLLHLLNNIIDISRIEANDLQVSLQETNVEQIVEKSAELFKFKANEKGLKFNMKLDETPRVYVDPTSLSKVVSDIIDNAVKYTEKGFINITSGYDKGTLEVFVKVRDTGIGIDDNYLPKVFEAFRQESLGYSRAYQGAGLGLPLAKRLLDLMDGRIDIESQKNEGTTVKIFLPTYDKVQNGAMAQKPAKLKKGAAPQLIKPMDQIYLFLVEDDRMNRLVINKMLDNEWTVVSAEDGDRTIEEIDKAYKKQQIFDLMLFDINLPSPWDGIKLMHHIRKKYPEYQDVPFIAQTAYAMRTDRTRLIEEGFDEYISKPINQQRLITMIYSFLSNNKE